MSSLQTIPSKELDVKNQSQHPSSSGAVPGSAIYLEGAEQTSVKESGCTTVNKSMSYDDLDMVFASSVSGMHPMKPVGTINVSSTSIYVLTPDNVLQLPESAVGVNDVPKSVENKSSSLIPAPKTANESAKHTPTKTSENGITTDWLLVNQQGVLDAQLEDDDEWDLCRDAEKLRIKEGEKTWNQMHRERMLVLIERRKGVEVMGIGCGTGA